MTDLKTLVHDALDRAVANGYGDFVRTAPPQAVAQDLMDLDFDIFELTDADEQDIIPHVQSWRDAHAQKIAPECKYERP